MTSNISVSLIYQWFPSVMIFYTSRRCSILSPTSDKGSVLNFACYMISKHFQLLDIKFTLPFKTVSECVRRYMYVYVICYMLSSITIHSVYSKLLLYL